jgi:hypothetical protein
MRMNYKKAVQQEIIREESRIPKGFVLLKKGKVIEAPAPPRKWASPVKSNLSFDDLRDDSIRIDLSSKIEEICNEFHDETMLYDYNFRLETDNIFPYVWNILNSAIEIEVNEIETDTESTSETYEVFDDFNF